MLGLNMFPSQFLNRTLAAAVLLVGLAGCDDKPSVNLGGPFHISMVQVAGHTFTPQLQDLQAKMQGAVAHVPVTNNPKTLRLHIADYHTKNPGISLIVGDSNSVNVLVEVLDPASGSVETRFNSISSNDSAINGVVGLVVSAVQDQQDVERRLNSAAVNDIMVHLYGSTAWQKFEHMPPH
jgi:hypothetical protein